MNSGHATTAAAITAVTTTTTSKPFQKFFHQDCIVIREQKARPARIQLDQSGKLCVVAGVAMHKQRGVLGRRTAQQFSIIARAKPLGFVEVQGEAHVEPEGQRREHRLHATAYAVHAIVPAHAAAG